MASVIIASGKILTYMHLHKHELNKSQTSELGSAFQLQSAHMHQNTTYSELVSDIFAFF